MITQDTDLLLQLKQQLEDFYQRFRLICAETASISTASRVPDATLQLNDVLQETERAATTILTAGSTISHLVSTLPDEMKDAVQQQITLIYEASSFQDISGQRIKKVLHSLGMLESQLYNITLAAKGEDVAAIKDTTPANNLMNGPQLIDEAPSQADIDALFN